ncbi:MAG: hypothetical protein RJA44_146, partial [Pseudomonadota bacterium]
LYTSAPDSLARRSAQTALWQITQAMLRWMAPFLSFTAEEAWGVCGGERNQGSIFYETFWPFTTPNEALLAKWARIRTIRDAANKEIEAVRSAGQLGSSLQATLVIAAGADDAALLRSLGDDLKFVTITSAVEVRDAAELQISVTPSGAVKCERCWHWRDDVGVNPAHPTICGRCDSNLHGDGESRTVA